MNFGYLKINIDFYKNIDLSLQGFVTENSSVCLKNIIFHLINFFPVFYISNVL